MENIGKAQKDLMKEIYSLRQQLGEANDTIEAIRTGQVDALVVQGADGHQLYTLKSADQTYRVFIEKMIEGAVTINHQNIIVYCNSKFASMVGLSSSNILGLSFLNFISPDHHQQYKKLFETCWIQDCKGEVSLKGPENETEVQLSLTTLDLDEGIALSIIITDLTAQKQTQKQLSIYNKQLEETNRALENSNHDLQQFASVASHDLQEPLRKIQFFSHMLRDNYLATLPIETTLYLDKIIDAAGRMKTLIVDILNYSKLSSTTSHYDHINLNLLVNDVLQDFDLIIQEKNAHIQVEELPTIEVNKGQIRQVFQNIISNALKFVSPGQPPEVIITGKRIGEKAIASEVVDKGPFCEISIRDKGIGFNEQYANNIFSLFERLHSKDTYEGTGIGLSIAKKIIEKHNGLIYVKSKEKVGSEFIIILPMAQTTNQA